MGTLISSEDFATLWAMIAVGTAVAIWAEQKYRWAARLSGPVIALLLAMILTNIRVMPTASPAYDFVGNWLVPLAIPLLLFRANLREIIRTGGRLFLIFHLSALGTVLGTVLAVWILRGPISGDDIVAAAGMMTASYIGGGVNYMAMKESYEVSESVTNPLIVADNFVMAGLFVVMLWMAASRWFRDRFPHPHSEKPNTDDNLAASHWERKGIGLLDIASALAFGMLVVALAGLGVKGVTALFGDVTSSHLAVQMIQILCTNKFVMITLFSVALATLFPKQLDRIHGPEEIGAYLLMVFLFTLGLPADLMSVLTEAPLFFVFCGIIAITNLVFTLGVGKIFRFNLEEIVVAVNANLGGAPTAAAVAIGAGWPRLILPGLLVGIWGYVIGTPIGIIVIELLRR
jgi:uncharacterized membrane protein